jgi:hypothetical protein
MPVKLDEEAVEGSTFTIVVEFNERTPTGLNPVTPNSGLKWTLHDGKGNVINSRLDVPIDPPVQSAQITLFGADLKTLAGKSNRRYVTVQGTYNGTGGNNLPLIEEVSFKIINLVAIT